PAGVPNPLQRLQGHVRGQRGLPRVLRLRRDHQVRTTVTTREGSPIVRKLTAAVAALATAGGLTLVVASSAGAAITAPSNGAVVRGSFTISDSGVSDGTLCANATKPNVTLQLINSGGTV